MIELFSNGLVDVRGWCSPISLSESSSTAIVEILIDSILINNEFHHQGSDRNLNRCLSQAESKEELSLMQELSSSNNNDLSLQHDFRLYDFRFQCSRGLPEMPGAPLI